MYKKIISVSAISLLSALSTSAFASMDNLYAGGQILRSDLNYVHSSYTLPTNTVDDNRWGSRFYVGYSFTDLISAELGYGYYGKPEFKHVSGNKQEMLQHGIDVVAKLNVPLDYGFEVYAKGGAVFMFRDSLESRSGCFVNKNINTKFVPTGGVGLVYNFSPVWSADVSLNATTSNGDLPKTYSYGFGLKYKFKGLGDNSNY